MTQSGSSATQFRDGAIAQTTWSQRRRAWHATCDRKRARPATPPSVDRANPHACREGMGVAMSRTNIPSRCIAVILLLLNAAPVPAHAIEAAPGSPQAFLARFADAWQGRDLDA